MSEVTNEKLNRLIFRDFSLMPYQRHLVLILIFEEMAQAEEFIELLRTNEFNVQLLEEENTGRHIIKIIFLESNLVMKAVFNKTEATYPVRSRMNLGINNIATGFLANGQIMWRPDNMKQIILDINRN